MKEQDFIEIIKQQIGTGLIGDDCAHLKELGIVISQDSLVEDIHFKRAWCTPYQLGYKSVAVNISDILASGAKPEYVTIALSLPKDVDEKFVEEFYKGAKSALHGAKIAGGDITGSSKIFVSITAIGSDRGRKISSRSAAKPGYAVISKKGDWGLSSAGLQELMKGGSNQRLIKAHLEPELEEDFSKQIAENIKTDYAMMDTSDGLADALFQIARASNVTIKTDYIEGMFGAEDYRLVAAVPEEFLSNLKDYQLLGRVFEKRDCFLEIGNKKYSRYDDLKVYDHFKEG